MRSLLLWWVQEYSLQVRATTGKAGRQEKLVR